jgi:hypothetical protein
MNNPTLLKGNVNYEQAMEIIDYLYGHLLEIRTVTNEYGARLIRGYLNNDHVINYNSEYGCIMVSLDFVRR